VLLCEVPFVSDDEVDDNDLTVAEDDDQIEDADTVIWSEVEQNLNVEELSRIFKKCLST
jgi:hypothetical protein